MHLYVLAPCQLYVMAACSRHLFNPCFVQVVAAGATIHLHLRFCVLCQYVNVKIVHHVKIVYSENKETKETEKQKQSVPNLLPKVEFKAKMWLRIEFLLFLVFKSIIVHMITWLHRYIYMLNLSTFSRLFTAKRKQPSKLTEKQQQSVPNLLPKVGCIKLIVESGLRVSLLFSEQEKKHWELRAKSKVKEKAARSPTFFFLFSFRKIMRPEFHI